MGRGKGAPLPSDVTSTIFNFAELAPSLIGKPEQKQALWDLLKGKEGFGSDLVGPEITFSPRGDLESRAKEFEHPHWNMEGTVDQYLTQAACVEISREYTRATKRSPVGYRVLFRIWLKGAVVENHRYLGVIRRMPSRGNCIIFEVYTRTPDELWDGMCGVKATLARLPHDLCQRCALQFRAPGSNECFLCALGIRCSRTW